jgi:hypothetical protein
MSDFLAIADRVGIEALRGEVTDAVMSNDHDRLAALFTPDGCVRIPDANIEVVGHDEIRALGEQRQAIATAWCKPRTRHHPARGRYRVRACVHLRADSFAR